MVGVAVKVTLVAAQIVVALAAILTPGVTFVVTVIVIELDVAVFVVTQASEVVITTVTISPLTNPVLWNVVLLVPVFTPFTFH